MHLGALLHLCRLPLLNLCLHLGALLGLGSLTLLCLGDLLLRPRLPLSAPLRLGRLPLLSLCLHLVALLSLDGLPLLRPDSLLLRPCRPLGALSRLSCRLPLLRLLPALPDLLLTPLLHVGPHMLGLRAFIHLRLSLPRLLTDSTIGL